MDLISLSEHKVNVKEGLVTFFYDKKKNDNKKYKSNVKHTSILWKESDSTQFHIYKAIGTRTRYGMKAYDRWVQWPGGSGDLQ